MTAGLAESGGLLRSGQAYAVNGQRPESNNYILDGASNINSVDGGFAVRTSVDAIAEFRILTSNTRPRNTEEPVEPPLARLRTNSPGWFSAPPATRIQAGFLGRAPPIAVYFPASHNGREK